MTHGISPFLARLFFFCKNYPRFFPPSQPLALLVGINALGLGIYLFLISPASRMDGWYYTALIIRITVTMVIFLLLVIKKQNITEILSTIPWRYAFPVAFFDVISFSTYNFAVTYYQVSYVTVITSASCLITVVLSYFFLHEKLKFLQLIGIILIIAGIVALQIQ